MRKQKPTPAYLRLLALCCLLWAVQASCAPGTDSLLRVLDYTLGQSARYTEQREARIARLKQELRQTDTASLASFGLRRQLYEEYRAYVCDSAVACLQRNLAWATRRHLRPQAEATRLELAYLLASAGVYEEAARLLREVDRPHLPDTLLTAYYNTARQLYSQLEMHVSDVTFRHTYLQRAACYDDSLGRVLTPGTPLALERQEMHLAADGRLAEALRVNTRRLQGLDELTPAYALVTYHRSQLYRAQGNREEEKRLLALSALSDVRQAITDHASLWNLAQLLYEEGDIGRAYRYIRFSWDETNRYNARSRSLQTAGILSLIDLTYQAMSQRQNHRLRLYAVLISTLALLVIAALAYIARQMKRLATARQRLEQANVQLSASNRIKEEYVGRFMNLCSVYINRLDSYRRAVNKKITAGQTEELLKMVRSHDLVDAGLKNLYSNFDSAFLHLFPHFVEQFNALLRPEERIELPPGELLNTELRIFALIRLGINDSPRIAEFLHYSINTIYNYRARVKNKAAVPRDEFEDRLMEIN